MSYEGPRPRWGTPRRPERPTHGQLLGQVAQLLGWRLFPWQVDAAAVALEFDAASRLPLYRTVGISEARQNGKTTLVLCRVALALIVPRSTVAYTAQDRNVARVKWQQYVDVLMSTPFASRVRHVSRVNGAEALHLHNGSSFLIVTPNENAGRSLTLDLVVIDEAALHHSMAVVGALNPTTLTRPHAQTWLLGNAGTFASTLWRHYTDTGRVSVDNPAASLCWVEYAADDDADVYDRTAWAAANPSLDCPGGVTTAALLDAALTLPADQFRREHLNLWVDVAAMTGIDPIAWAACRDDDAVPVGDLCLSLDFTPERDHGTVVVAGLVAGDPPVAGLVAGDGRVAVEVVEHSHDLEMLIARTVDVAVAHGATVVLDRGSPAASAIPALERAGVPVRLISLADFSRACGDLYDAALSARVTHRGDYRLSDAVAGATKRLVGDGWVWRRRGGADIAPLVAATLARWGVLTTEPLQAVVW